jgi:hypothetical protein
LNVVGVVILGGREKKKLRFVRGVRVPTSTRRKRKKEQATSKVCSDCNQEKLLSEFYNNQCGNPLRRCKKCHVLLTDKTKALHPERGRASSARYRKENPEKARETNRVSAAKRKLNRTEEDELKFKLYYQDYYQLNIEKKREQGQEYYLNNKEKYKVSPEVNRIRHQKENEDPKNRIHKMVSSNVYHSLKKIGISKNNQKVFTMVNFSLQELMDHLEFLFQPGMTWDNYGKYGWEVDHIIPRSFFEFTEIDSLGFKVCWSLENLQPLWMVDNIKKGNKIFDYDFVERLTLQVMDQISWNPNELLEG